MRDVLVVVADDAFAPHAKALLANCMTEGRWAGDVALLSQAGSAVAADFRARGITVVDTQESTYFQKFDLFGEAFLAWDRLVYYDCDVVVQRPMAELLEPLAEHPLWMDTEDGHTMRTFFRDPHFEDGQHAALYQAMREEFPWVDDQTYNSSCIVMRPGALPEGLPAKLREVQARYLETNRPEHGGTDQQIINLVLQPMIRKIPRKMHCYWGLGEEENDGPSESRGYVGGEVPVSVHYARWYAPWVEKRPQDAAYMQRRLGVPCIEVYRRNLAAFDRLFPRVG